MRNKEIKIAVAGCGYWGKNLVRNFAELGALAAVFDAHTQTCHAMAEKYSVRPESWKNILSDPAIDGVAIAAPASLHYTLASEALAAGKHVFVEKPLALTTQNAKELIAQAEEKRKMLMVGHLLQYHAAFIKVKELLTAGALGTLRRIYSNRLSFGKIRTEENVLWSFAPHDISMILALAGTEPTHVTATGSNHISPDIADYAHVHLTFPGIQAHIFVSWLNPFKEHKLVVVGSDAMVVFDDTLPPEQKIALYRHKAAVTEGVPILDKAEAEYIAFEVKEPLKEECQHFIDCAAGGHVPRTDGHEGLRVLRVLERAQTAMDGKIHKEEAA